MLSLSGRHVCGSQQTFTSIYLCAQAAKTYLERHFVSFPSCSLDQLIQHALKALQVSFKWMAAPSQPVADQSRLTPML